MNNGPFCIKYLVLKLSDVTTWLLILTKLVDIPPHEINGTRYTHKQYDIIINYNGNDEWNRLMNHMTKLGKWLYHIYTIEVHILVFVVLNISWKLSLWQSYLIFLFLYWLICWLLVCVDAVECHRACSVLLYALIFYSYQFLLMRKHFAFIFLRWLQFFYFF